MAPPPPGSRNGADDTPPPPLLPRTGVDSASVFDLPYATDDTPLPPPPDLATAPVRDDPPLPAPPAVDPQRPVVPPTFASPRSPSPPPIAPARTRPAPAAPASMPAPISAGSLVGPAFYEDDDVAALDPYDAQYDTQYDTQQDAGTVLPPMVAKGTWEPAAAGAPPAGAGTIAPGPFAAPAHDRADAHRGVPVDVPTGALAFTPEAALATPAPDPVGPAPSPLPPPPVFTPLGIGATPLPTAAPAPVPLATSSRLLDGFLVATAGAIVAAVAWWAAVTVTERQFAYLALLLGIGIGQAALVGGRRGSVGLGIVAGTVTLLAFTATQYFITRSLAIAEFGVEVPLWTGTSTAIDIIRETFEDDPLTGIFVLGAALVAGIQAGIPGRRASGPLGAPPAPAPIRPPIL